VARSAADAASRELAGEGVELRARSDCGQPRCGHIYHYASRRTLNLDPVGDRAFGGRDGRVMSLTLTLTVAGTGGINGHSHDRVQRHATELAGLPLGSVPRKNEGTQDRPRGE
jgi:hypothetical protein